MLRDTYTDIENNTAVTIDSKFPLMSVTKVFTASTLPVSKTNNDLSPSTKVFFDNQRFQFMASALSA